MAAALALLQHHQYSVSDIAPVFCSACSMMTCSAFYPSVKAAGPGCEIIGDLIS
jgi:hypothetical protein